MNVVQKCKKCGRPMLPTFETDESVHYICMVPSHGFRDVQKDDEQAENRWLRRMIQQRKEAIGE